MTAPGALLPYRSERERQEGAGKDALAKPSGGARYLRIPAVHGSVFEPHDAAPSRSVPTRMRLFKFGTTSRLLPGVSGRRPEDRSGWSWSSIAHKRSDIEPASVKGRMP